MRRLIRYRFELAALLSWITAVYLWNAAAFPGNALLASIYIHRPRVYIALRITYAAELFLLPLLYGFMPLFGIVYRVMNL
ncbi:MAG: hypothetical protein M3Z85_19260, partial [Acidobacteriota bacterium]|nr:hypothetical protein [Acidobacteriota bacterium]